MLIFEINSGMFFVCLIQNGIEMENKINYEYIIGKLDKGIKFGLFEDGARCYFRDGEQVSYTALWKAIRTIYNLPDCHHKTLTQLCPDTFAGTFTHKYAKHNWKPEKPERPSGKSGKL